MHAHETNLSLKRLIKLQLNWDDRSHQGSLEKEVLNELKPDSDSLKELRIVSYAGINFPNWVGGSSFHRLVHVSIRDCRNCTFLPPLGQLSSLKELYIQGVDKVKVIDFELTRTTVVVFPSLEILRFEGMSGWEVWSTNSDVLDGVFPRLRELYLIACPKLINVSLQALPLLSVLEIRQGGYGVLRSLVQATPSITKLEIAFILGLTYEAWRGVIEYLGALEELIIQFCNEIRYLWESEAEASKVLVKLKKLDVRWCDNLVSLGEKEEDEDNFGSKLLSSLKILHIHSCDKMERLFCPENIESLRLNFDLGGSVTPVSFPSTTIAGQKLRSLYIRKYKKLMENINNTSMLMLETLDISEWTNLKSIIQLSNSIHLTKLVISNCESLESFPDLQLSNLTLLKHMRITNCPSMDASFPRGLWPLNLEILEIGGLKKPISGLAEFSNFPFSPKVIY